LQRLFRCTKRFSPSPASRPVERLAARLPTLASGGVPSTSATLSSGVRRTSGCFEACVVANGGSWPRHTVGLSQRPAAGRRVCRMLRQCCSILRMSSVLEVQRGDTATMKVIIEQAARGPEVRGVQRHGERPPWVRSRDLPILGPPLSCGGEEPPDMDIHIVAVDLSRPRTRHASLRRALTAPERTIVPVRHPRSDARNGHIDADYPVH
jgi:hypothetical protein